MAKQKYTIRVPSGWAPLLDSRSVAGWLADLFCHPRPLPDDPGPGDARVSLYLSRKAVRVLAAMTDSTETVALRRLVALNAGALPEGSILALPVPGGFIRHERELAALPSSPGPRKGSVQPLAIVRHHGRRYCQAFDGSLLPMEPAGTLIPRVAGNAGIAWGLLRVVLVVGLLVTVLLAIFGQKPPSASTGMPTYTSWTPSG